MNKSELEEASINFIVCDYNGPLIKDTILGAFELDITSVYFSLDHEYYQSTLILVDPEEEAGGITVGMLKVSVQVLGPDDEPVIHDINYRKNPVISTFS